MKIAEVSASALRVPHSRIREVADAAMAMGPGTLRLYFGESNLPTPAFIREAARRAMDEGYTYYTENAGLPSLREALARKYAELHGAQVDPSREIVVTAGGVQALQLAIRCVLDPGDEAVVITPAWQNQMSIPMMVNATVRMVGLRLEGRRYQLDLPAIENAIGAKTRLLIFTSPSNPPGWVARVDEQRALLEIARRRGVWLLADEVYERLWYAAPARRGAPEPSLLPLASRSDSVIVAGSFSKAYCMTGWRVGWIVAPAPLAGRAAKLNEFIVSCAPAFAQKAAETALAQGEESIAGMLEMYRSNRDACRAALSRMPGVVTPEAEGAFYLFPRIAGVTDSFEFCMSLLREERVGLAPGAAFGDGGDGAVRICYAVERPILDQAIERLGRFISRHAAR